MKSTIAWAIFGIAFLFASNSVDAWGGIYNSRFSPETLQNMGFAQPHRFYQVNAMIISFYVIE